MYIGLSRTENRHRAVVFGVAACLLGAGASPAVANPVFYNLGTVIPNASVETVSSDGMTVGGASGGHGFKWSQAGGLIDLGLFSGGTTSRVYGLSANGNASCGAADYATPSFSPQTFVQYGTDGLVAVGNLMAAYGGTSYGVSADGSVVAGVASTGRAASGEFTYRAFRWTSATGIVDLGTLGGSTSWGYGIDASGGVIVGETNVTGLTVMHAFRWTQGGGMVDITPSIATSTRATAVSGDGNVVAGWMRAPSTHHAFRWTAGDGVVDLGMLGSVNTEPLGVNADGSVIVGTTALNKAWIWKQGLGIAELAPHLQSLGVDLTEGGTATWSLKVAKKISADGSVIVGTGTRNGVAGSSWMVTGYGVVNCGPGDIGRQGGLAGADGHLDNNDLVVFIDWFFGGDMRADVGAQGGIAGSDGLLNNNDFVVFIDELFAGCA
jgi:probable HAF family extracellular repeat protein